MKYNLGEKVQINNGLYKGRAGEIVGHNISVRMIDGKTTNTISYLVKLDKKINLVEVLEQSLTKVEEPKKTIQKELPPSPFKVGDKVAIPTTKSIGSSLEYSHIINMAKRHRQEYLYVIDIKHDITIKGVKYKRMFMLSDSKHDKGGDYFLLKDLKPYIEPVKKEVVKYRIHEHAETYTVNDGKKQSEKILFKPATYIEVTYDGDKTTVLLNGKYKGETIKLKEDKYDKRIAFEVALVKAKIKMLKDTLHNYRK